MFSAAKNLSRKWTNQWLFQLREAEPGEVFLKQRRVFIMPTQAGLAFSATLVVLFIGSVNYELSLGFVLTFLVASCGVIDMHLTFRNMAHLYLRAGKTQPVFAGEEAQFELHLINRYKYGRYAIWLGFLGDGIPTLEQAADIAPNESCTVNLHVTSSERGWLAAPRVRLQTRFPLGLLRSWSYWLPDSKALVYPYPEEQGPPLPMLGIASEDGQGSAGHDDFAGVRAYQAGDSMKHLAWRQIARIDVRDGGALVTKHFEGGAKSELCLDFSQLPRAMDVEMRLSRMTRWVLEAEQQGLAYDLGSFYSPMIYGGDLTGYIFAAPTRFDSDQKKRTATLPVIKAALVNEFACLRTTPPSDAELARVKRYLIGSYKIKHERIQDRATLLGISEMCATDGAKLDTNYAEYINAVTAADVVRVAKAYFNHPGISVLEPANPGIDTVTE